MLGQRRRRWASIKSTLDKHPVLAEPSTCSQLAIPHTSTQRLHNAGPACFTLAQHSAVMTHTLITINVRARRFIRQMARSVFRAALGRWRDVCSGILSQAVTPASWFPPRPPDGAHLACTLHRALILIHKCSSRFDVYQVEILNWQLVEWKHWPHDWSLESPHLGSLCRKNLVVHCSEIS